MLRLGIDLGGTKIEIIALDPAGKVLLRHRQPTPIGDYSAILRLLVEMVKSCEATIGETGTVGIGTPGAISKATGCIKNSNSTCLIGQPLQQDLTQRLQRTVRIANDADCFTLSEATDGAASGADTVFGVILGTGVGGGIVAHGRLLNGPNGIAGEWGHNPLPWPTDSERPGPDCYCGRKGCIETFLSGPALSRSHQTATGEQLNAKQIVQRAEQGDPRSEASMMLYEERLARSLAHVINILDPDVIVLGGGISNCQRLYREVSKLWSRYLFTDQIDTQLVTPKFGDSSGVRGAAWLS